jgi:general secretion pathway protein K
MAILPGLDLAAARQLVQRRERGPWTTLEAARLALGPAGAELQVLQHSVQSRYFEVLGRMRIDNVVQQDRALLKRDGGQVSMLWRTRSHIHATNAP